MLASTRAIELLSSRGCIRTHQPARRPRPRGMTRTTICVRIRRRRTGTRSVRALRRPMGTVDVALGSSRILAAVLVLCATVTPLRAGFLRRRPRSYRRPRHAGSPTSRVGTLVIGHADIVPVRRIAPFTSMRGLLCRPRSHGRP